MLASLGEAPLVDPDRVYEPKYDGIRALVDLGGGRDVRLYSRNGHDKTAQFPAIAKALADVEARVAGHGRLLVRYSGTEPLARVMVEGEPREAIETAAKSIAETVRKAAAG